MKRGIAADHYIIRCAVRGLREGPKTCGNGKTPPRDRDGVFRDSAGDSTPAKHPVYNLQGGRKFRAVTAAIFAWPDCWGC